MLITSPEELEALPVGDQIRIRGAGAGVWTRVEGGFSTADGAVVGLRFFAEYVKASAVTRQEPDRPSVPGDWWQYGRYNYLHLNTQPTGSVAVGQWRGVTWHTVTSVNPAWFARQGAVRLPGPPSGLVVNPAELTLIVDGLLTQFQPEPPEPPKVTEFKVTVTGASTAPPKVEVVPV